MNDITPITPMSENESADVIGGGLVNPFVMVFFSAILAECIRNPNDFIAGLKQGWADGK